MPKGCGGLGLFYAVQGGETSDIAKSDRRWIDLQEDIMAGHARIVRDPAMRIRRPPKNERVTLLKLKPPLLPLVRLTTMTTFMRSYYSIRMELKSPMIAYRSPVDYIESVLSNGDNPNTWVIDSNVRSDSDIALLPAGAKVLFTPLYLAEVLEGTVRKIENACNQRSLSCFHVLPDQRSDGFLYRKGIPPFTDQTRKQWRASFDKMVRSYGDFLKTHIQSNARGSILPLSMAVPMDALSLAVWAWCHAVFTLGRAHIPGDKKSKSVGIMEKIRRGEYSELHDITFLHIALGLGCGLFTNDKLLRECALALSNSKREFPLLPRKMGEKSILRFSFELPSGPL